MGKTKRMRGEGGERENQGSLVFPPLCGTMERHGLKRVRIGLKRVRVRLEGPQARVRERERE